MPSLETKLLIDFYIGGMLHFLLKPAVILLGWLLRRNHDLTGCRDVTYLKLLGGGSIVIAYPSLLALKHSGRKLRMIATDKTAGFARSLGIFDEVLIVRDQHLASLILDVLRVVVRLWRTDAIVDLEIHSRLSTVLSLLTLARNRIGAYTENSFWRRGLSTHLLFYNKAAGVYLFYDQITQLFGAQLPDASAYVAAFRQHLAAQNIRRTDVQPDDIAVAPCCSELGRERMFRPQDWPTALQTELSAGPVRVHFLGGPEDRAPIEHIIALTRQRFPSALLVNHAGTLNLLESFSLVQQVRRLYCIDSALLHVARLLGTPTTSYWGPTDPATRLRPSPGSQDIACYGRIACSPCVHIANVPPCRGCNICMQFALDPNCGLDRNPIWLAQQLRGTAVEISQ